MARSNFGGTAADYLMTVGPGGQVRVVPGTLTFWSAETGGTQYTDLLVDGAPVSTISVGRDGQVPTFQGPDGIGTMWADGGGADRVRLLSDKTGEALASDAFIATQLSNPTSDTFAASDAATATQIGDPGSEVATALEGKIAAEVGDEIAAIPRGRGLSRVHTKLLTGQSITISFIGDSGLEGTTAGTPGTDDTASLVCSTLADRYGVTVTKRNRAISGYRAYSPLDPSHASPTKFSEALADAADLYVISFGHNDIKSDVSAAYVPGYGYPDAASVRAVEHMIRRIRIDRPGADILISNEWQYTGSASGSNLFLTRHGKALRRLASTYGCAFADYYAALAALGVTGSNPAVDDIYVHASGGFAQHPTSAGCAVWAQTIADQMPLGLTPAPEAPMLPPPVFGAERYTHTPWTAIPAAVGGVRAYGTSGYRLIGSQSGVATLPVTMSTVDDAVEVQIIGHEAALRLDVNPGYGHVKIEINGRVYNADLNLGALGTGQTYFPLDLGPGVHRIKVTLLSGTFVFRGCEYAPTLGNRIPHTSSLLTYTGTWSVPAGDATYFEGTNKQTTTLSDTVTVEWVGTALWLYGFRYGNTTNQIGVTNDGGTETVSAVGSASSADVSQAGGFLVTSGLPYGRHTTIIRQAQSGRALSVSTFLAFDETRTDRPRTVRGLAVSSDAISFPVALPGKPAVRLSPDDATSAIPPYPSAVAATGFTANGTASARHQYEAETGRVAY